MKKTTIIGEVTGGGVHDNKFVILNDNFMMSLPFAEGLEDDLFYRENFDLVIGNLELGTGKGCVDIKRRA